MDDRRDDLDRWLQARIDPLPPPPGTFEMIKRRARRRRYRQVAVSAAAAAAVAAAVIVVPHVTSVLRVNPNPTSANAAAGSSSHPANGGRGTVERVRHSGAVSHSFHDGLQRALSASPGSR